MNRLFPFGAALAVASAAASAVPRDTEVPPTLDPGGQVALATVLHAEGVQIYECRAREGAAAPEWVFVAPEATLLDEGGRVVGTHGAGPHWAARDASRIEGRVSARADAPEAGAIPWLLLGTRSVGPAGAFSPVTHVQRVNTAGGVAPAAGCSLTTLGATARVAYRADYRFYAPR